MVDPVSTLVLAIERETALLPAGKLFPVRGGARLPERLAEACGRTIPDGLAAFFSRYDGGVFAREVRLFSFDESWRLKRDPRRAGELKGLWPIVESHGRLFALDAECLGPEGEWPVVELADRSVDRAGSTFLRYLHTLLADVAAAAETDEPTRAQERCRRDPALAEHWVEWVELLDRGGRVEEADEALFEGLRSSNPLGPALLMASAMRAVDHGDRDALERAIQDALELEPLTARDDDARLDAAAVALVIAQEQGARVALAKAKELLGSAAPSTGAYWRGEAIRALAAARQARADLALSVVQSLVPDDSDVARLRSRPGLPADGLAALVRGRDALDRGAFDDALPAARTAVLDLPELGLAHALLAEVLNARRERGGMEAARRAADLNPALIEAWRELGDGYLEQRQAAKAEEAYREVCRRDPGSGIGLAKLAQAQLEQGRTREALETVESAG